MKRTLNIQGMSCQHCVGRVKALLDADAAVSGAKVSLEQGQAEFECDDDAVVARLAKEITDLGYPASEAT